MAVVGILSHGKDGIVYAADGQSIDMEYIYEYFNNKNCPALQVQNSFCIPITFNNSLRASFSNKKYLITIQTHPTQIVKVY